MRNHNLLKFGIATFAVAVLGAVPAFTAQADTNVAEKPNTASKPVENAKPSDLEKPEVKLAEEVKPEAKSTANSAETQLSDAPGGDANSNKEKHRPIRYVIELDFKDIRTGEKVEPTKTLTGNVNFGEDLTIAAPTFEGYRLQRAYPKILNISYDNLNDISESKDGKFILTKEGDTIVAHCQLEYETLPLEKPNRGERTLHISFSYTGTPKIMPDGTLPPHRKYHSIDEGKRNITVTIKPGESFTLPKGDIDGYILEQITDVRHEEGRWGATTGNPYKPGETVPYEKFNFYPAVVDGVESDHISVNYGYYRPAGYIGYEKPSQPTEKPAPKADENQEPIKYNIDYFDADTGERISREIGVLNPGETINIHKNIDGYEVVTNRRWMSGYNVDYRLMDRYFGSSSGYRYMFLEYKKVNADAKPSETPKPAPKDEEKQKPLKYRIDYLDADTGERISREIGVLNPGETINIYKDIEGYEVVSYASWMPGYKVNYRIMNTYFGGTLDDNYMYLKYKKVNVDAKPSETPKPEVKPEPKPSDTPKPAVKPEPKPSDTSKPVTPVVPTVPTTPVTPTNPATPSTSRVLSNEAGSVQVRGSEATLKNVSYIKVEETEAKSLETKSYKAYDIHLYDANGKAIQPNGMVLVTLSADKPVENVYYVAPDGALQALDFKQDADKVTFETNHFSIYAMTFKNIAANRNDSSLQMPIAVVGGENTTTTAQNSNGADATKAQATPLNTKTEGGSKALPNTGEQNSILGFAGFLLASLGLAGLTYKGRH